MNVIHERNAKGELFVYFNVKMEGNRKNRHYSKLTNTIMETYSSYEIYHMN
jgi:hypothetical protein